MIFAFVSCEDKPAQTIPEETVLFAGGNGSPESPFQIETAEQFARIGLDDSFSYILNNDITLPADTFIEKFYGKLDGNNKTLSYSGNLGDTYCLIWGMMNGAEIKNLNVNIKEYEKTLVGATAGKVLFENVNISGDLIPSGNNVGGYLLYVGYCDYDTNQDKQPANVTFRNCTNKVNISDKSGAKWGFGPFLCGMAMSGGVASESTLTYEGCVNEGQIYGGHVGWVAGNQSEIDKLKAINVKNCKNDNGGYVKGFLKAGDISWGSSNYANATVDNSFKDMVILADKDKVEGKLTKATKTITLSSVPENTSKIIITGTFFVKGFANSEFTENNVHMTDYIELKSLDSNFDNITLETIVGVDSKYKDSAITDDTKHGAIIESESGDKYVYIGEILIGEASTIHTCLDPKEHKAELQTVFATCYNDKNEIISTAKLTIE